MLSMQDSKEEITMRKFIINVNGNSYEVEVEEVGGAPTSVAPVAAPAPVAAAPAPAPAPAPKAAPAPAAAPPAGATNVNAPMPGNIVSVKVAVGDTVNEGDVLVILEAMKMENEIMAPCAGKVVAISANQGASVNTGDVLVSLG